jgi:hypothetical protein
MIALSLTHTVKAACIPTEEAAREKDNTRTLHTNWLAQLSDVTFQALLEGCEDAAEQDFFKANRSKSTLIKIEHHESGFQLAFYYSDPTGTDPDSLYNSMPFAASVHDWIALARRHLAQTKSGDAAALKKLKAKLKAKGRRIDAESEIDQFLMLYKAPLEHLITETNAHGRVIKNAIDLLLYIAIVHYAEEA